MLQLDNIELRGDPCSAYYVKNEIVAVEFALVDGELMSREGPNRYRPDDAIVTGSTGDRWCVSRDRFDAKYEAVAPTLFGQTGNYRNKPIPILAKQMHEPFSVARSDGGDVLRGESGDWVVQYAPGDYGLVEQGRFAAVYRRA
jgi:hypothetical protein